MAGPVVNIVDRQDGRPLSLQQAKQHLHVTHNDDDTYIAELVAAAVEYVETLIGVALIQTDYQSWFPAWQDCFELPRWPAMADPVPTVQYYADDTLTTLAGAYEFVRHDKQPSQLVRLASVSLPTADTRAYPIVLNWRAGYAADAVPATLVHALKLLVRHWYDNREPSVIGTISTKLEYSLQSLLNLNRIDWARVG